MSRIDLPFPADYRFIFLSRFQIKTLITICCFTTSLDGLCGWQAPLSSIENTTAVAAVLSTTPETKSIRSNDAVDTLLHPLGVQVVMVEPLELKNSDNTATRLAEVFTFDYLKNISERYTVDLLTGDIVEVAQVDGVHLPLSESEIDYAKSLLWKHKGFQTQLQLQFSEQVNEPEPWNQATAVQARVSIWVTHHSRLAKANTCEQQRCALISLVTDNEVSLPIEPIVNLVTGEIYLEIVQ